MPDYSSWTDEELIALYYEGQSAFGELSERYRKKLFVFFLRATGSRDDADDQSHNTWLRVMMNRFQPMRGASFHTWVFRIATNLLIDFWRRQGREVTFTELQGEKVEEEKQTSFEEKIEETPFSYRFPRPDAAIAVHECLSRLPEKERVVAILCFMGELTLTEIAKILEVSPPTVMRLKQRASAKMRRCLEA